MTLEEANKSDRAIAKFQNDIRNKNVNIGELENQSVQEKPVTVGVLEEDLDREKDKLERLEREKENAEKKHREQEVAATRAKDLYERRKRETEAKQDTHACKAKLDEVASKIKQGESHKKYYNTKKAECVNSMKAVEKDIKEKQQQVEQVAEKARRQMETRPEVIRSVDEINKELKNLQAMAREQERIQEPLNVIMDNLSRCMARYKLVAEETRQLREDVYRLAAMLVQRNEGFRKIRESISNRVRMAFHVCLQTRKFGGNLSYNHKQRSLFVQVNPEGSSSGGDASSRGMRTLSGGEKSYSTISLILALWEVMAPPFRFLDEFDVFMDALNRRLAIEQVKQYATRTRSNQYILLTPLNLQGIEVDDSVRITKLEKSAT